MESQPHPVPAQSAKRPVLDVRAALPDQGRGLLVEHPAANLLVRAYNMRATGLLGIVTGRVRRLVHLQDGLVAWVASNVRGEQLVGHLHSEGRVEAERAEALFQKLAGGGVTESELVLQEGILDARGLKEVQEQLAGLLLRRAAAGSQGEFMWKRVPRPDPRVPRLALNPLLPIFAGLREHGGLAEIMRYLAPLRERKLAPGSELSNHDFALRSTFNDAPHLVPGVKDNQRIGDLLQQGDGSASCLGIFAMLCTGMARVAVPGEVVETLPPPPSKKVDPDAGMEFNDEEREARDWILAQYDAFSDADHYTLLGVEGDAPNEDIKAAFFKLAKRYHIDQYGGMELGSAHKKLEALFALAREAYETLLDEERRKEYDFFLDRKRKGLPTDPEVILEAEAAFKKGARLLERGEYPQAETMLRKAVELNPGEAEHYSHLAWALYNTQSEGEGSREEAKQLLAKSFQMQERQPKAFVFMGQIALLENRLDEAKQAFAKALQWRPRDVEAQRGKRLAEGRIAKQATQSEAPGLTSRLKTLFKREDKK